MNNDYFETELKAKLDVFKWVAENFSTFSPQDQIMYFGILLDTSDKVEPLFRKYNEDKRVFFME